MFSKHLFTPYDMNHIPLHTFPKIWSLSTNRTWLSSSRDQIFGIVWKGDILFFYIIYRMCLFRGKQNIKCSGESSIIWGKFFLIVYFLFPRKKTHTVCDILYIFMYNFLINKMVIRWTNFVYYTFEFGIHTIGST